MILTKVEPCDKIPKYTLKIMKYQTYKNLKFPRSVSEGKLPFIAS